VKSDSRNVFSAQISSKQSGLLLNISRRVIFIRIIQESSKNNFFRKNGMRKVRHIVTPCMDYWKYMAQISRKNSYLLVCFALPSGLSQDIPDADATSSRIAKSAPQVHQYLCFFE